MQRRAIFWGATGQAKVCRDALQDELVELVAVFDVNAKALAAPFPDVPLLGANAFETWLGTLGDPLDIGFLVTIGGQHGQTRLEVQDRLEARGLTALTAQHPRSHVARDALIGAGSQISAGATVCVGARLGRGCIVNTNASIDHECSLGDGVHVAPGATLAGCVTVGDAATIYSGATVGPRVAVGEGAVIGAGSVVLSDVPDGMLVVGSPARVVRRVSGER